MNWRAWCAGALLWSWPVIAVAQTTAPPASGPYVAVGAGVARKATGAFTCAGAACEYPRTTVSALMAAAGIQLRARVSLEISAEWPSRPAAGDIAWRWSYTAPVTNNVATHRDVPVLAVARYGLACTDRVCLEPWAGVGIAVHQARSVAVTECGSVGAPLPCTPVSSSSHRPGTASETSVKRALAAGIDLPVRVTTHVTLRPGLRMTYVADGQELFADNFRGPNTGSPWVPTAGVLLIVR